MSDSRLGMNRDPAIGVTRSDNFGRLVLLMPCAPDDDACADTADPAPAIPPARVNTPVDENPSSHRSPAEENVAAWRNRLARRLNVPALPR